MNETQVLVHQNIMWLYTVNLIKTTLNNTLGKENIFSLQIFRMLL